MKQKRRQRRRWTVYVADHDRHKAPMGPETLIADDPVLTAMARHMSRRAFWHEVQRMRREGILEPGWFIIINR